MLGWVSPRLGITFELVASELVLYYPNGEPFASYLEISEQKEQQRQRAEQAEEALEQAQEALELERSRMKVLLEQLKAKGINPEDFDL